MVILLYLVVQYVVSDMVSGRNKSIVDYSFFDYVMSFWSMSIVNHQGVNGPINGPLWFIRDLMVMVVISPLIYWSIKKFKIWIVMGFIVLWLSGIWDGVPGLGIDAILFFSLGAYLGMRKSNFIKTIQPVMWYSIMLYLIMMTSELLLRDSLTGWCHKLTVIVGIVMFVSLAVWLLKKREVNTFFAEYTFFVFASHNEILKIFIRLITKIHLTSDWAFVVAYFVCPVITIVTCCCIFKLMRMYCPRVIDLVCGGR